MSFLGPAFLIGLAGVSLPVLIHLLKRRRLQVVAWAAHRFLQASLKKHQRRVRFEDLILLLLRCLVIALLAFAFARPVFQDNPGAADGNAGQLVLLVDLSASMGWTDGVRTSLERAADEAARELAAVPAGTSVALFGFSDRVHPLVARPTPDLAVVRRELSRLRPVGRGTDLAPALRATLDLFETLPASVRRVVILGDRQRLAFRDRDNLSTLVERARAAGVELAFRDIAAERAANLAVTRLVADSDQVLAGQPVRLQAEIFNGGSTPATNLRVTLHAGDERPAAERLVASLAAGERAVVEFTYLPPAAGFQPLSVRVPADPLAADDARSLVVRVSEGTRVLLVEGPGEADKPRPGFFLGRALVPVPLALRDGFPVKTRRLAAGDLTPADFNDTDVAVLAGVNALAPASTEALAKFVRAGGGLWVFPPAEPDFTFYNESAAFSALLPAVTGLPVDAPTRPAGPPYAHPLVDLWNEPANGSLTDLAVNRHFGLVPRPFVNDGGAGPSQTVLRLGDGDPLFLARTLDRGRVLQSAVPADAEASDLPLRPAFVPLVQRGLSWLTGDSAPVSLSPGDTFVLRTDPALLGTTVRVLAPGRAGDPLPAGIVELVDGQPSIRLAADDPGVHRVYSETGDTLLAAFAVNLDPAESDLTPAAAAELAPFAGESAEAASGGFRLPPILSRDLWVIIATTVLILAAAELLLAQRFSRQR